MTSSASMLLGVVARTEPGRRALSPSLIGALGASMMPSFTQSDVRNFWRDRKGRVAIYMPNHRQPESVLAIRGAPLPRERWHEASSLARMMTADERGTLSALRGEFSLAFWNEKTGRILLARDALGQRGMFLRTSPHFFVFCSELAPLLSSIEPRCELDRESAMHFLAHGRPSPGRTLAVGVSALAAGHAYVLSCGEAAETVRYFTPLTSDAKRTLDANGIEDLRARLDDAITTRTTKSGTQGILLSGGIDSTYIAMRARATLGARRGVAYTIGFEDGLKDERDFAAFAAKKFGFEHRVVSLGAARARTYLGEVLKAAQPCSAWATMAHRRLLDAANEDGIEEMLSGLGSDELFGGYDVFEQYAIGLRARTGAENGLGSVLSDDSEDAARLIFGGVAEFFDGDALRGVLGRDFRSWRPTSHHRAFYRTCLQQKPDALDIEMMVAHECAHRIPTLLSDFDTLARAASVRFSYPFLDLGIAKIGCGLSYEARFKAQGRERNDKLAVRAVARPFIPRSIMERAGASYTAPFGPWLRSPHFGKPLLARLTESAIWDDGLLRRAWLSETLRDPRPRPRRAEQLWVLVALAAWYERYVLRDTRPFVER